MTVTTMAMVEPQWMAVQVQGLVRLILVHQRGSRHPLR